MLLLFSCPVVSHYNMPSLPVPHHIPEFAQVHIQGINNAFQPSHSLLPSSPSAFNLSQHQGLFQWVHCSPASLVGDQSIGASASTSVLPMSIQGWFPLRLTGLLSFTIRLVRKFIRVFSIRCYRKIQMNCLAISMAKEFHPYTCEGRRHIFKRKSEYRKVRILLYFWQKVWCSLNPGLSQRLCNSIWRLSLSFMPI